MCHDNGPLFLNPATPTHPTRPQITRPNSRGFVSSLDLRELSAQQQFCQGGSLGGGFQRPQLSKALSESVGVRPVSRPLSMLFIYPPFQFNRLTTDSKPPIHTPNTIQRQGLRKNLSLIELSGSKRGEMGGEEGMPEPTQSPTATAVSWQQYVVRITEDEEEGVFF